MILGPAKQAISVIYYSVSLASFLSMQFYVELQKYWLRQQFQPHSDQANAVKWAGLNSYIAILLFLCLTLIAARLPNKEEDLYLAQHMVSSLFFLLIVPIIIIMKNENLKLYIQHQLSKSKLYSYTLYFVTSSKKIIAQAKRNNQISPNIWNNWSFFCCMLLKLGKNMWLFCLSPCEQSE